MEIEEAIKRLGAGQKKLSDEVIVGTVLRVNKEEATCDIQPINDDADMLDVQLKAIIDQDKKGIILYPKVGSTVVATVYKPNVVLMMSEVEGCNIYLNGFEVAIAENGEVVIDGGDNGGLPIVGKLVDSINKLEEHVRTIYQALATKPAANGSPIDASLIAKVVASTNVKDIANDKIKH